MTIINGFQSENKDGHISIKLPGTMKGDTIAQIEKRIDSLINKDISRVDVSLLDVENVYSVLITIIMKIKKKLIQGNGLLYLVNVSERCRQQLESMNLDKVLTIHS